MKRRILFSVFFLFIVTGLGLIIYCVFMPMKNPLFLIGGISMVSWPLSLGINWTCCWNRINTGMMMYSIAIASTADLILTMVPPDVGRSFCLCFLFLPIVRDWNEYLTKKGLTLI